MCVLTIVYIMVMQNLKAGFKSKPATNSQKLQGRNIMEKCSLVTQDVYDSVLNTI